MRIAGVVLALLWASWWVFFEAAEAAGSGRPGQAVIFVVLMFGAVLAAWKRPLWGGAVLLVEAAAAALLFAPMWLRTMRPDIVALMFGIMCAPPFAAGLLLIAGARRELRRVRGI